MVAPLDSKRGTRRQAHRRPTRIIAHLFNACTWELQIPYRASAWNAGASISKYAATIGSQHRYLSTFFALFFGRLRASLPSFCNNCEAGRLWFLPTHRWLSVGVRHASSAVVNAKLSPRIKDAASYSDFRSRWEPGAWSIARIRRHLCASKLGNPKKIAHFDRFREGHTPTSFADMILSSFFRRRTIRLLKGIASFATTAAVFFAVLALLRQVWFPKTTANPRPAANKLDFKCPQDSPTRNYLYPENYGINETHVLIEMGKKKNWLRRKVLQGVEESSEDRSDAKAPAIPVNPAPVERKKKKAVQEEKKDAGQDDMMWIDLGSAKEDVMAHYGFGNVDDEDNSERVWWEDASYEPPERVGKTFTVGAEWIPESKLLNASVVIMEPFKPESHFSNTPRITYFNGHRGCNENLRAILARFRLNFNVLDPRKLVKYGMEEFDARTLVDSGWVNALCSVSDIIIIADTVPDARGILLSLLEKDERKRCKSNIVVELTNRFDWMISDNEPYYRMMRNLTLNPPKNLWWTANNPFEAAFFASRVGVAPNITLLRSMGAWDVDSQLKAKKTLYGRVLEATGLNWSEQRWKMKLDKKSRHSLCTVQDLETTKRPKVGDILDYYCMPIVKLNKKYGGPVGLLKFKGFVHFPYQTSVMKFYENVAMGVPQVIPTPRLIRAIVKTNNHHLFSTWLDKLEEASLFLFSPSFHSRAYNEKHEMRYSKGWNRVSEAYDATWTELSDFHRKEFEPFVYYFDSFAELAELIRRPVEEFDWKNVRVEGPKYYAKVRKQSIAAWAAMFKQMGYRRLRDRS
ncbi:hypothetical protein BC830DRAFT_415944 [Chytriomyces sp. MP71]|nr:hypothetical protein BC830DRAFT_415944 [Chytriomyces sp. MP71]